MKKQVKVKQAPIPLQPKQASTPSNYISPLKLLPLIIIIRFTLCLFLMRNYDYPDEYWQGPQIAHIISFGYGYRTWEWTMQKPIRNHVFPLLISTSYEVLKLLKLDHTVLIIYGPKFIQFIISSLFDYFLIKINNIYNPGTTWKLLILNYTSWFSLTMMSRIYINSFETLLTLIAFYLWNLRHQNHKLDYLSRAFTILNFVVRGTSVMFWAIIWPFELFTMKGSLKDRIVFIFKNFITICLMLGASIGFQFIWRGQFTFIEYNFIYYNIVLKWSQLYGNLPFFSYFYLFLPFILAGTIPFFYHGIKNIITSNSTKITTNKIRQLLKQCLLIMLFLSISNHKQPRFLLILFPMYLMISVRGYSSVGKFIFAVSVLFNLTIFSYHNIYGKTGSLQILEDIRRDKDVQSVLFLTQCHFTPMYSNIHHNVPIIFPDCSPINRVNNVDENSIMFKNATEIYQKMRGEFDKPPSHLVIEGIAWRTFNVSKEYYHVSSYKNCGFWEQLFMGYNDLSLYKRHNT